MVILTLLIALLASVSSIIHAADLEGTVLDSKEGLGVSLAVVTLGEDSQVESNEEGRFRFTDLATGRIGLRVEHVGYEVWTGSVLLQGPTTTIVIRLEPHVQTLEALEVRTTRPDRIITQGKRTIEPMQIRSGAGTIATDPIRAIQALPGGAAAGDDFSNQYVVRGGDPEENRVLIDGYPMLQPDHLEGFTSVIYDDLIRSIEVFPGAVPPRYGHALSSITSFTLVEPLESRRFFRYDLGSIAVGAEGAGKRWAALGAGRSSFYNLILRRPPGVDERSFRDLSAKVYQEQGAFRLSATTVLSFDREKGDFDRSVDAALFGLRFERRAGDHRPQVACSYTEKKRTTKTHRPPSEIRGDLRRGTLSAGGVFDVDQDVQIRFDVEARQEQFDDGTSRRASTGLSLSTEGSYLSGPVSVSAGGRLEKITFTDRFLASPYLSFRAPTRGPFSIGGGWRILRQSPFHLTESPEVAGLPVDPSALLDAGAGRVDPLAANHVSLTGEVDLGHSCALTIEIYEKRYDRLLTWGDDGPTEETLANRGEGRGRGIEAILRKRTGAHWSGWISASFSRTEKREGPSTSMRPADYDRPRMFQGGLEFFVRKATTLSFAFRSASGRPITPLLASGSGEVVPGPINSERLPAYGRLDAKLEHRIEIDTHEAFFYVDVLNLANRKNTVDVEQFVGAGGEVIRIYNQGVRILPVAGFGLYF